VSKIQHTRKTGIDLGGFPAKEHYHAQTNEKGVAWLPESEARSVPLMGARERIR